MQKLDIDRTVSAWSSLAENVFVPDTESEYNQIIALIV